MISSPLCHCENYAKCVPVLCRLSHFASPRDWLLSYPGGGVDLEKDEKSGIAVITLNHTERRNALSGKMMVDLADIVCDLEKWSSGKGVILHGAGDTFCSGGDLNLVKNIADPEHGRRMCEFMQDVLSRLFNLPLVSVALLSGQALGGGAELSVACDFRLVTESATVGFVQGRMGVSPGWGGGTRLVQLLGRTAALELLLSGRILNCKEAIGVGLASKKVDKDALINAKEWLSRQVRSDLEVTRVMKKLVVGGMTLYSEDSLKNEKNLFTSVWGGPAHLRAMSQNIKHNKK